VPLHQSKRQAEGAASSSINNELAYLLRMFNYARKFTGKAKRTPVFPPDLPCSAPRDGFLEDADFYRLVENAQPWFYTIVALGREYCWRRNELLGMRVGQVDLIHREIRLRYHTTKSGEPRVVPLNATLTSLMSAAVQDKKKTDHVFTRPDGTPVLDFRDTWWKASCRAGLGELYCRPCLKKLKRDAKPLVAGKCPHCEELPNYHGLSYRGLNFHDLRRTGARNMSEQGTSESVIMEIGGWKTNHIFKRYRIVPKKDMARAMAAYEESDRAFRARQAEQDLENTEKTRRLDDETERATSETKLN
jgi:integrase